MGVHIFHVNKLNASGRAGIAVLPVVYEVPAGKPTFQWRGDVAFTVTFPGESPFELTTFEGTANGAVYETDEVEVRSKAKVNRVYKFTVDAGQQGKVDPIIIIRTIRYFREIAKDIEIESLGECDT